MQTLDILKDVRNRFGISQPDKNGMSTFDLCHLLFALVNDSEVCTALCAKHLAARTWRVTVKTNIQIALKRHLSDSFAPLSDHTMNYLILLLLRVTNISESLRAAFKLGSTLPDLAVWIDYFRPNPPATTEFESVLVGEGNQPFELTPEEMIDVMSVAGTYSARLLPETYRHLVPQVVSQFRAIAKLFSIHLEEGVAAQLLINIELFQNGDSRFKELLQPLTTPMQRTPRLAQFLYGEQPLPQFREKQVVNAALSVDTKHQIKQIGTEIKKQAPKILLEFLEAPHLKPLQVDHDRLAEFALTYVEKISRNNDDIEVFLDQVCKHFPNLQNSIEGANFLLELAGNAANSSQLCEKRRLSVFKKLNSLFESSMYQDPDIAIIFGMIESCKSTRLMTQEQFDAIDAVIRSHQYSDNHYSATLHQKMIHRLTLAFYYGAEANLRRLAHKNNQKFLKHLILNAPPDSASKLLRRIRNLLPVEVFNQCVLQQHELLNDKYHLFKHSGNLISRLLRRTQFGRYLLGDAPGDDFAYEGLICQHPMRRVGFISILFSNPNAREGFFNSEAIAKSDATYFALFYSQALQMSLNQMDDEDKQNSREFVTKLLHGSEQRINPVAMQKFWTGLSNVDQAAMIDLSGVALAIDNNFDPVDALSILSMYVSNKKIIHCQNVDRTGKNGKIDYNIHLPTQTNSFDEIFFRILKDRVNKCILLANSVGEGQRYAIKPESSSLYLKLQSLAQGLFANEERHARFAEILGFILSSEAFAKVSMMSPIIQSLCDQLKAGDLECWSVVTKYASQVDLKIDHSVPGKIRVQMKSGIAAQTISFEIIAPPAPLVSLLKEYDVQLHQSDYTADQQEFAKRVHNLCGRLDQVSADELIEVLSTPNAKPSTLLTLMTSDKFASCVHKLNIVQPGLTCLVYEILEQIQKPLNVSEYAKIIAQCVKGQLERTCEPLEVNTELAIQLSKTNWRQPQAQYYVSPGMKIPSTFETYNNLHPTELDLSTTLAV